jgi:hypothetical protein
MCCGNTGRLQAQRHATTSVSTQARPTALGSARPALSYATIFEYLGTSSLTATGLVTGKRYRFDSRGARVRIDPRDRPGLARVPHLRQVVS